MSSPLEVLIEVRKLLSDPKRWTKGLYENLYGAFCLIGAMRHVMDKKEMSINLRAETMLILIDTCYGINGCELIAFNDRPTTTHGDVLAFIDTCIEKAKT